MISPTVQVFWEDFLATRPDPETDRQRLHDVFAFDDNPEGAAFCAAAVIAGDKVATSGLLAMYDAEGRSHPVPGDLEIVTEFDGTPRAVIGIERVDSAPYGAIDAAFARAEGDGSLTAWRKLHQRYYGQQCAELGLSLTDKTQLLRIFFRCIHPTPRAR
ncbi:MAG: ASCH domain-containing protein [Alphaproteobacteria bacterium]|nr:ASCH domain-containing protein [Alphaproteobacteria bacterium]